MNMTMTRKDEELIERAWHTHYQDWGDIFELREQAETEEAKERLHSIACSKYHMDEYHSGII